MPEKEKMVQIFEAMTNMTIEMLDRLSKRSLYLSGNEIGMVRTTQSLYETLNYANHPVVTAASMLDVSGE